jgi:glyceraldehyde 3-phosphate dehydrogenase
MQPRYIEVPVTQAVIYGWYDNELGSYCNMLGDRTVSIAKLIGSNNLDQVNIRA